MYDPTKAKIAIKQELENKKPVVAFRDLKCQICFNTIPMDDEFVFVGGKPVCLESLGTMIEEL